MEMTQANALLVLLMAIISTGFFVVVALRAVPKKLGKWEPGLMTQILIGIVLWVLLNSVFIGGMAKSLNNGMELFKGLLTLDSWEGVLAPLLDLDGMSVVIALLVILVNGLIIYALVGRLKKPDDVLELFANVVVLLMWSGFNRVFWNLVRWAVVRNVEGWMTLITTEPFQVLLESLKN